MSALAKWFGLAARDQWGATAADRVDWVNDTIKVSLHTSAYTPDQDAHDYYNDLTNELATGGGYTNGGAALASKTLTYDGPSNTVRFKCADVSWPGSTWTARYAVLRKDTGVAGTSHLLGWIDFGADQSPAGVNFAIQFDATDGVLKAVAA
jgi:hypothetical protein